MSMSNTDSKDDVMFTAHPHLKDNLHVQYKFERGMGFEMNVTLAVGGALEMKMRARLVFWATLGIEMCGALVFWATFGVEMRVALAF